MRAGCATLVSKPGGLAVSAAAPLPAPLPCLHLQLSRAALSAVQRAFYPAVLFCPLARARSRRGAPTRGTARRPGRPRPAPALSSPIRLARSSTDRWPSKCGVVKNGESSCTSACLSARRTDPEHDHVVVPLAGVRVEGVGARVAEEHERLAAHLVDRVALPAALDGDVRHAPGQVVHVLHPRPPRDGRHGASLRRRRAHAAINRASGPRRRRGARRPRWRTTSGRDRLADREAKPRPAGQRLHSHTAPAMQPGLIEEEVQRLGGRARRAAR